MSTRAFVLNCPVELCNIGEALSFAQNAIQNSTNFQIITINPEMIMNAQKNKAFFDIIKNSDLNIAEWGGKYEAWSAPAYCAFFYMIPYVIGIAVCVLLSVVFKKKSEKR